MLKEDGFSYCFDPQKCQSCGGKCCTGENGYIWIDEDEMSKLSRYLDLDIANFKSIFTYQVGVRFSLKEKEYNGGFACVFFNEKDLNCGIYEYRPKQCKTFPFWSYFKKNYNELEKECIGVKQL
ncbi:putative Fe-S cluster-containing protein [Campylobacter iguaniorum]|uniref:YkgJ family cysteine cluster protein n=1 Tax=Campylobacter iguaniorum TaxID=1244531 RepID=UPI0007C9889C|nr:YkgJ family cysteine cluster protein [Campylobacter iguaniorum]ANE35817.1 putative Fe-S cluster-containing protein [Campylobacter iguaniorum]